MIMTVKEIIDILNKVEDKSKTVYHFTYDSIDDIQEYNSDIILW